jgi:LacI family transcriptional regulator
MSTIKEIAVQAELSVSTVSVVLRGEAKQRKISTATQEKIWKVAQHLGYQPNISARRLRDQSSEGGLTTALFWANDFRVPLMIRFLRGMREAILSSTKKHEIIIRPYVSGKLSAEKSLHGLSAFNAAIICNASATDMVFLEDNIFHVPIVLYNRHSEKFCTVGVDNTKLGTSAAEVFASRGHRFVGVLNSREQFPGMATRVDSFLDRSRSLGLFDTLLLECDNSMAGGYEGGLKICNTFAKHGKPDCIFCASDVMAIGALRAFHDLGVRIPNDIELISVGNGDKEQEEYSYPSLSVVHLPMEQMARSCFEMLQDLLEHKITPPYSTELPIEYIARESCGSKQMNHLGFSGEL